MSLNPPVPLKSGMKSWQTPSPSQHSDCPFSHKKNAFAHLEEPKGRPLVVPIARQDCKNGRREKPDLSAPYDGRNQCQTSSLPTNGRETRQGETCRAFRANLSVTAPTLIQESNPHRYGVNSTTHLTLKGLLRKHAKIKPTSTLVASTAFAFQAKLAGSKNQSQLGRIPPRLQKSLSNL